MSRQALRMIIDQAVADYGFRLAVMWGTDDVAAGSDLTSGEAEILRDVVVPELKKLPNPVEPDDHVAVQERLAGLTS
ncbi:MAG: hypothetical protein F4Z41_01655 [Acidimicrobiia bacterium]|nr:hypothetical protein [bacterium]MXW69249.1 hypothetical protein [Acidimicrobiia bacterium]MDE0674341.1 hypothetical protein [bacterium]MXX01110.1 hypothetical protein [Acidimicrobiia bacterium]MXX44890.1 hypothetical protein [Acidimicrobiia bacterium]